MTTKVKFNGAEFRQGCFLLIEQCSQFPVFGCVEIIILENEDCNFLVEIFESEFVQHYSCFKLIQTKTRQIVNLNDIKYYQPVYSSKSFANNDPNNYIVFPLKSV